MVRSFFVLLLFLLTQPAFGWHVNTHLHMTRDAISLMPPEFQKMLQERPKFVESGIKDPDEVLKDFRNHYYIPSIPEGGALERIDKIIRVVETKLKDGSTVDTAKHLCLLAHYIGDVWSPESLIKKEITGDPYFALNHDIVVVFEGYERPISNYREYLEARSKWRWKLENSNQISSLLYSEAVNDIAQIWLSLWVQSGKTVDVSPPVVIEHLKGALQVNFEAVMKQDLLETAETAKRLYASDSDKDRDQLYSRLSDQDRISETLSPDAEVLAMQRMLRDQIALESFKNPKLEFSVLESSLKPLGNGSFFVARIRNKGQKEVQYLSLVYAGLAGSFAEVNNFKPGQIVKIEATLPANATKENIRFNFSLSE